MRPGDHEPVIPRVWGITWASQASDARRPLFLSEAAAAKYVDALNAGAMPDEDLAFVFEEGFGPPPDPAIEGRLYLSLPLEEALPEPERVVHTGEGSRQTPVCVERVFADREVWHIHGTDRQAVAAAAAALQDASARGA